MKGKVLIALMACICFAGVLSPVIAAQKTSTATPLKICFWPKVWSWPVGMDVRGVNFGIANFNDKGKDIIGWDFSLLLSQTDNVTGFQSSILTQTKNVTGAQAAIVNMVDNFSGAQLGVFNQADNAGLFQLGLINKASKSKGLQIGLINFMDNGLFPVFPFFNYSNPK